MPVPFVPDTFFLSMASRYREGAEAIHERSDRTQLGAGHAQTDRCR